MFSLGIISCEEPKDVLVGWGDSMMKASLSKTSILDVIADELNVKTYNFGEGGLKSNQVAALQGGLPLYLVPNDSLVVPNGDLELMPVDIRPFNHFGTQEYEGTIEDMSGSLQRIHVPGDGTKMKHYLFKRGYSWVEKKVKDTLIFTFDNSLKYAESMTLIWAGRNDKKSKEESKKTVANLEKMVHVLKGPAKEKYLILSICNGTSDKEGKDSKAYQRILNLNNMLKVRFQEHFIDVRAYMVKQAIYDMDINPSPQDLADIQQDCIPSVFFKDHVHFNQLGNIAVGKYIAKIIQEKGWLE